MEKQKVWFRDLGKMDYKTAWDYQEMLLQENLKVKADAGNLPSPLNNGTAGRQLPTTHHLLFVEHPPVYTLGKSG
ncbi:MAG TPA: lipoate-protein ligase B, partial [Flavisolibacter sp.]|nr:lipoate-protein ligase B [Flavisolibacter sp.]